MNHKVTMQDIADKLNLSKNSVSQAISGKSGVSEETRKLIHETAQQMGYIYSQTRSRKSQDRSGNIMIIASDYTFSHKSFFSEIYLSVEQEASKRGLNLLLQTINKEAAEKLILPLNVQIQAVDGILILSHISIEYTNLVIATGIPTVLVDHHHPEILVDCVLTNNRFGAYNAVQHLIDLGHREIGFIGEIRFSPSYYERMEGFLMALNFNGLEPNEDFIISDAVEQVDYISKLFSQIKQMPTAWFCANDHLGFLVNSTLQQQSFKIPEQVSVCSFDNGQLSQIATPGITSIAVDLKLYGRKAIEQLLWRITNKEEPFAELLLPTTLIQRESTGKILKSV